MTRRDIEARRKWAREYLKRNPEYAEKARERSRIAQAEKRAKDPGFQHRAAFYQQLVEAQGGETCGICGDPPSARQRLQVDHDHTTDEIRGLLCARCNRMLGQGQDSAEILRRGLAWLERPGTGRLYAEYVAVPIKLRYTKKEAA